MVSEPSPSTAGSAFSISMLHDALHASFAQFLNEIKNAVRDAFAPLHDSLLIVDDKLQKLEDCEGIPSSAPVSEQILQPDLCRYVQMTNVAPEVFPKGKIASFAPSSLAIDHGSDFERKGSFEVAFPGLDDYISAMGTSAQHRSYSLPSCLPESQQIFQSYGCLFKESSIGNTGEIKPETTENISVRAVDVVPVTQSFIGKVDVSDLKDMLLTGKDSLNKMVVTEFQDLGMKLILSCATPVDKITMFSSKYELIMVVSKVFDEMPDRGIASCLFIVLLSPSLLNAFPIWLVHGQLKGLWHICKPPPKPPPFNIWLFASVSCLYFQLHATCLMKCPTTVGNIAHCQRHFGVTQYKFNTMPAICHHVIGYIGVILMRDQELFNASNQAVDFFGTFFPTADFSWLCRPLPKPPPRAATLLFCLSSPC